jgi:alkyl hydroperoxide reductase subunit D
MTEMTLEALRERLPDPAKDLRLNLQAVLGESSLTTAQKYGVALASAIASRSGSLQDALTGETRAQAGEEVVEDALAAAALMGMNNVYYRFRHMIGKEGCGQLPARLRMNRLVKPAGSKLDFELFALAVSAINGCESCVQAHERTVLENGLTETQVNDTIRIAATIHGVAVALDASRS